MNLLTDPFTPATYPDLFTWMWVAGIVIALGAIVVYNLAQRRYRRYPELLALHEWVFWPIIVTWGVIPLLAVIGVPLHPPAGHRARRDGDGRVRGLRPASRRGSRRQTTRSAVAATSRRRAARSRSARSRLPPAAAAATARADVIAVAGRVAA